MCEDGYFELRNETIEKDDGSSDAITAYYDIKGNLCIPENINYAKLVVRYTKSKSELEYYNAKGEPVVCDQMFGTAKTVFVRNPESNMLVEIRHYGTDGGLMLCKWGVAVEKFTVIEDGEDPLIECCYYDTKGNPAKFMGKIPCARFVGDSFFTKKAEILNLDGSPCEIEMKGIKYASYVNSGDKTFLYDATGKKVGEMDYEDFLKLSVDL